MTPHLTFRQLESSRDRELVAQSGVSPLEAWYEAVRDKPIESFTYNDLCRACRQQVFPEAVMPIAIATLRKEPLAGEMYDGELLAAVSHIGTEYWANHPSQAKEIVAVAQSAIPLADEDLQRDLAKLLALDSLT